ncbi:MAG: hypothetical protein RIR49_998 [Actinomycetota bacterium]
MAVAYARRVEAASTRTRFQTLAAVNGAMVAGEATMVVALADSFFFDVDLDGARSRLLAFLVVSFAPFLFVASFTGRLIDRARGGRRAMVVLVAVVRAAVQVAMIAVTDDIALFPLVFAALVLQKTYNVSKQALVPAVVSDEDELVEANSKLGFMAGLAGAAAVVPAAGVQLVLGSGATLAYGTTFFVVAALLARSLPGETRSVPDLPSAAEGDAATSDIHVGWVALLVLRAASGFTLFHVALWMRSEDASAATLGAALIAGSAGAMVGNLTARFLRRRVDEERMLAGALVTASLVTAGAVALGGHLAGVVVAAAVNLALAIGRLSFESIIQRDGPVSNRAHAFARFETGFQFGWVVAATLAVLVDMPGLVGLGYLAVVLGVASVAYVVGSGADLPARRPVGFR